LPDASTARPWCSSPRPCHRLAATGPTASAPLRRPTRGPPPRLDRAARPWPSQPSGRPHVAGHRTAHCSYGLISAQHCAAILNRFLIVLNSRNYFKLPKFVETCTNIQKLQNKFFWTPIQPLFIVSLTKLTFMQ
jgi:hypothetical protein